MIVGFWKPALQAFGSQEIFCIIKRKFWDGFSCAAENVTDIGTVQFYRSFSQVTFFMLPCGWIQKYLRTL